MKQQIIVPVYYHKDSNGKIHYDFEMMAEDFEMELSKLDKNVVVMCSVEEKEDYKPYTNIDNIVNDMLTTGGKK